MATPKKPTDWSERIQAGVRAGIADALESHRRAGREVPVMSKGKVVWLTVDKALAAAREEALARA
jgi:hypothetical protein